MPPMFDLFKKKPTTLTFYMKSGNSIVIDGVTEWSIKTSGGSVTSVTLTQRHDKRKLILSTLNLDQIEAVVEN